MEKNTSVSDSFNKQLGDIIFTIGRIHQNLYPERMELVYFQQVTIVLMITIVRYFHVTFCYLAKGIIFSYWNQINFLQGASPESWHPQAITITRFMHLTKRWSSTIGSFRMLDLAC